MNEKMNPDGKRSLMNSLDKLNSKVAMLEQIDAMSEQMLEKMKRTDGMIKQGGIGMEKRMEPSKTPDIIDLFDSVSDRMNSLIEKIGNNIDQTINMIE